MTHWTDYFPIILLPFKIIVVGICMFFAIKWHYDQDQIKKRQSADSKSPPDNTPTPENKE
ncbi:hypothetical protein FHS81_002144 [Pseudochelatococcus contaminans]|uniref:Uncharacterized protein n=1 Tax=Pseudochelatococcus contaminans TaxID=1538103 RepID=A0A7W5Z4J7_9HYPH|nr:hypothetical protein [Pseudochelatococcus contaminans]